MTVTGWCVDNFNITIKTLIKQKPYISEEQALFKVQELCSHREKCKLDIEQKLQGWGLTSTIIERIFEKLEKDNFISEERYAIAFVKDKFRFNKWGKIKISYALSQKRIPEKLIENGLNEINENEYLELIENEIEKKISTLGDKSNIDKKKKLLSFLSGKGFENGKIFDLVNKALK